MHLASIASRQLISTNLRNYSRPVSKRVIIPPASHFKQHSIGIQTPRHDQKQLPEDSNYIEKFYNELGQFKKQYLKQILNKSYSSFENDPDELIFQLEKYIELSIIPKYTLSSKSFFHIQKINLYCISLSDKIVVERYLEFINAIRLTLRLNGGHSFIFDTLLEAKRVFNQMEKNKYSI